MAKKKKAVAKVVEKVKAKIKAKPKVDRVACELELRRYVRRDGGYRKGATQEHKDVAQQMLKLLGRTELSWDKSIVPFLNEQRMKA